MSKILHVVKEARGGYQIRESGSAGEGAGAGRVIECADLNVVASELRARGCNEESVTQLKEQLLGSDNAEIRV